MKKLEKQEEMREMGGGIDYSTLPPATNRFYDFVVENDGNFPEMAQKVIDYVLANKPEVVGKYYETFEKEIESRRSAGDGTGPVMKHLYKKMREPRKIGCKQ